MFLLLMLLSCTADTGAVPDQTIDVSTTELSTPSRLAGLANTNSEVSWCGVKQDGVWVAGFINSLQVWGNDPLLSLDVICSGQVGLAPFALTEEVTALAVLNRTSCQENNPDSEADNCFTLIFAWEE